MKNSKIQTNEILFYAIISCVANLLASLVVSFVLKIFIKPLKTGVFVTILTYVILLIGILSISSIITYYFLRNKVSAHYEESDDKRYWMKSAARLMIPGEVFRFILCWISLGHVSRTGLFGILPTFLFEQTYVIWSGRYVAIRQELALNFGDYLAYAFCYLICLAIQLTVIVFVYRYLWNVRKKEREELVARETKSQYF